MYQYQSPRRLNRVSSSAVISTCTVNVSATSPLKSSEAPAKLGSPVQSSNSPRRRAHSLPEFPDFDCFLQRDSDSPSLKSIVAKADIALKNGVNPELIDGAMGGTYFLSGLDSTMLAVCKPADEEPHSPNNPYQQPQLLWVTYKGCIVPGFGMYREIAAFVLDDGFCGVPPTGIGRIRHPLLHTCSRLNGSFLDSFKPCSIQAFVESECSAEDMGPSLFRSEDVQRIAIMDIRWCNLDRHEGNILVTKSSPFQLSRKQFHDIQIKEDAFCRSAPSSLPSQLTHRCTVESTPSPRKLFRLVPIDHGYILPHALRISETSFCWINWPQVEEQLDTSTMEYVNSINVSEDIRRIKAVTGNAIPESCLLTLQICSNFLQKGISAGLTLGSIGAAMTTDLDFVVSSTSSPHSIVTLPESRLQKAINEGIAKSVAKAYLHSLEVLHSTPFPFSLPYLHASYIKSNMSRGKEFFSAGKSRTAADVEIPVDYLESNFLMTEVPVTDESLTFIMQYEDGLFMQAEISKSLSRLVSEIKRSRCRY